LLKQTTEVKTLPIAHVPHFQNRSPAVFPMVCQSRSSCSSTDHSIWHTWPQIINTLLGFLMVVPIFLSVPLH